MEQQTKTAIIAGATGLVGEQLLSLLLEDPCYGKVIAVVRRELGTVHPKLVQMVVDFGKLPEGLNGIQADHGYCCLGTTLKVAGSKERQYVIDHDYVVAFARECHLAGVSSFAVVSSVGANPNSSNFYLRTKGEMERDIQKFPFASIVILQPSFLLGNRKEFRAGEKAGIALMKALSPLMIGGLKKYRGVQAEVVAKCMIRNIQSDITGIKIIRSDMIIQEVK
ncbi:MAG: oxidoreductase [Bacteroidales bacterium]